MIKSVNACHFKPIRMLRSWTNAGDSKFNGFRAGSLFLAPFFSPTRFSRWLANGSSAAEILTQKTPAGAVSLIPSALEINAALLCKVLASFSFSHVTKSCSLFISFLSLFFFLSGCQMIITNSARYLSFDIQYALTE